MADEIPDGVYWDEKEATFFDAVGKRKGGKFFDEWKARRDEFPTSRVASDEFTRARTTATAGVTRSGRGEAAQVARVDSELLAVARARKAWFDAYVEVGFTRDEALELILK